MKIGICNRWKRGAKKDAYNSSRKRYGIAVVLLALALGLCTLTPTVRAEEMQIEKSESAAAWIGLSSKGSLVYREGEKGAQIYAADFLLLRDKLDSISDTVFEPTRYTHTHQWEYRGINEKTHTRHCESCGDAFDIVSAHRTQQRKSCSILHNGDEYPGIRCTCVCGYQWEQESSHTLFFEAVDENVHRSGCCLEGTKFCSGYEPITEEHYAYFYEPCEDGCHHVKVCMDCGYRHEEACCFDLPGSDHEEDESQCLCGNVKRPDDGSDVGEPPSGTDDGDESGDALSDTETGNGSEDDSSDAESGEESTAVGLDSETEEGNETTESGEER